MCRDVLNGSKPDNDSVDVSVNDNASYVIVFSNIWLGFGKKNFFYANLISTSFGFLPLLMF